MSSPPRSERTEEQLTALRATLLPLSEARMLPRDAYGDERVFALERRLFAQSWLCVAHESELSEPGAFAAFDAFGERICVIRGHDGKLAGLVDRCLHRGTPLTEGLAGRLGEGLTCPYHGMRYDLRGRVLDAEPALCVERNALAPVRVAHWQGFVFACTGEAPPLREWMGPAPEWLVAAPLAELRLVRRTSYEVAANWKLLVENFQESHHFPHVHPGLEAATPWRRSRSVDLGGSWLGGVMQLAPGAETVSLSGKRDERPFVAAPEHRERVHDGLLCPAWLTSLQPDYLLSYRLMPRALDRTMVVADIFFAAGSNPDAPAVFDFWERTNAEDRAICERQQRGVAAPSFVPGRYAASEDGVHAFDRRLAAHYLVELDEHADLGELAERGGRRRASIAGIFGQPFAALEHLVGANTLAEVDREVTLGLARVETSYTGGSLKWMNVVAPWQLEDGYRDAMHVIEQLSRAEFLELVSLAEEPNRFDPERQSDYQFGDETEHPLTKEQMRWLAIRHGVYFPWKTCYHLLENDRWEDKHSGAGKAFTEEACEVFPRTVEVIRSLPFREIGRVVLFGLEPNDHAPLHRDTEPGRALSVAQSITLCPRGDKRFYLCNAEGDPPLVVDARVYWFNDMDYHGVLADPFFRYSIRIDGVFHPSFVRELERKSRARR